MMMSGEREDFVDVYNLQRFLYTFIKLHSWRIPSVSLQTDRKLLNLTSWRTLWRNKKKNT